MHAQKRYNVIMKLMREVRCFPAGEDKHAGANTWAGTPRAGGFEPFWALRAVVEGPVDDRTGYVCDIRPLDEALRRLIVPALLAAAEAPARKEGDGVPPALIAAFALASEGWPPPTDFCSLELSVSPLLRYTATSGEPGMVRLTQSFEFSAAHRLFCETLTDEQNSALFGKCSNPHGHGHNYVLEVTVCGEPDPQTGIVIELPALQRIVAERVVDRFDHKNLNVECAEFSALNPSVENIARVIWNRLVDAFASCRLVNVRVWETPKTYADFDGS